MSVVIQVLIGLLTIFLGFVLGFTWQVSRRRLLYWRARRFWRPFVSKDLKIVVGRFDKEFHAFEASGVVGVGDMQAAAEVVSFFDDLGLRRLGSSIDIVYHDQLTGDQYGANLVCIGGPDSNVVTEKILNEINHTIEVGDRARSTIEMKDNQTGKVYDPKTEDDRAGKPVVTVDYGLLVQAPNPFDPRHKVMIVAGSYGYGTWAGVKLARSPQFLRSQLAPSGRGIECLFETKIMREIPQQPKIILLREISTQPAEQSGQVTSA
jgi:hypothetical protein